MRSEQRAQRGKNGRFLNPQPMWNDDLGSLVSLLKRDKNSVPKQDLPVFDLAAHGWTEPIERVLAAAHEAGTTVAVPRPGEGFEPTALPGIERWWPALPWKTDSEGPLRATLDGLHPQLDVRGVA